MKELSITDEHVREVLDFTEEVVKNYPRRLVGTPSCIEAGKRIAEEFSKNCDPSSVKREEFTCHPEAFLKYIRPAVIAYIISMALVWLKRPFKALIGYGLSVATFVTEFAFYKEYIDPLFPKKKGYNVYVVLEPEGEVRQQIILCGHHDAAYVFHYMKTSPRLYPLFILAGIFPFVLGFLFSMYMIITKKFPRWMKGTITAGLSGVIPLWWFTTDEVSPGAGDNMIATAIANEATKIFADQKKKGKNPLKHTRIICLSVDGEESGLRGSRAFVKRHEKELKDIKTYVFCMDTLYNADKLIFFDNDLNLTVDLSHEMAQELVDIATSLGYKAKVSRMPWGGGSTDAASFGQKGIEATCLLAFELDIRNLQEDLPYHTPKDTPDKIEPLMVKQALTIIREYILKKDREVSNLAGSKRSAA
ncbi:MAG: M28 family peptidase [Deltaproteobacteria bacterium]|nr:M28 family peptidase [Deltaproteobacteria bacterium]